MNIEFDFTAYLDGLVAWAMTSGLRIGLIVLIALLGAWVLKVVLKRFRAFYLGRDANLEKEKRADTMMRIIRSVGLVFIAVTALMMILAEFGVDLKPIIAAAGIGGIAIGFGAQSLVKDVISGFFILLENQIRVGDVVEIGTSAGLVEKVGLRVLVLRDFAGKVHIIPNGTIDKVINLTKDYSRYIFDIGVAYREDVDEVMGIMRRVGEELKSDAKYGPLILEPLEVLGLDQFGDSALIIKARITTKPIEQWTVAREFNRRLKNAFDAAGVEIPFPHTTLYLGEDKQGQAPPLRVVVNKDGEVSG